MKMSPDENKGKLTEIAISPNLKNKDLENVRTKRITGRRDISIDPKLLQILSTLYPRLTVQDALIRYSEEHEHD